MIGIIAAVSLNGVIGVDGIIPWHYPDDFKHFKNVTRDSIVIMGRKTFESIGKPLKDRENIVITSQQIPSMTCYDSVATALRQESIKLRDHAVNTWFIGGVSIYQEAMLYADHIFLTITPEYIKHPNPTRFPWINPLLFEIDEYNKLAQTPKGDLIVINYRRCIESSDIYEKIISNPKVF